MSGAVVDESWAAWSEKPLLEISSPVHNKLSSRSRSSVNEIMEKTQRRMEHAENSLKAQASARAEKVHSQRQHEAEVRQRHDDSIKAIGETSARKMASAEATRLARLEQQQERLRREHEHAEAVRLRKMQQTEETAEGGSAGSSSAAQEGLLIDMPWTTFGDKAAAGSSVEAAPAKDNPLHAKLSARSRKSVDEIMETTQRRMESARLAKEARDAQASARLQREREKAIKVKERHRAALDDLEQASARKMAAAEEKRAAKLHEQAARLQREKERAEEVRRRRLESPEKAPPQDPTETPAASPNSARSGPNDLASAHERARRQAVLDSLATPIPFKAEMVLDAEGKPLVMEVPAGAWVTKRSAQDSARGADMHLKLSARTRKAPEEVMQDHTRRQAAAEVLRQARDAKEKARIEKARAHEDQVRLRIETNATRKSEQAASKSEAKMQTADDITRRKAARECLRAERKRQREKSAKARQQNATRTFGSTMLDDDDKLRLLKVVKENKLAELEEMATGGELGRLRNFQNHYGDSALILAAWYGHIDIAKLLLDVNADVDIANCDGNTALNCAAYRGHHAMVELLLIEGSEVDVQDNVTGKTALIKAAYGGHTKVVQSLLEAESDPDALDSQGYGALAFAASFGHRDVLQALLEYDADPDVADQFGITPSIHAAARGDYLSVKMLLEAGATPTREDIEGKSAIDYADSAGFDDVVQILGEFAEKDPNSAGMLLSSSGAITRRIQAAENAGNTTSRGMESSREYSMCPTDRQASARDYAHNVPGLTPRSARAHGTARLTPRMPPPMPSNRPRVPLGGVADAANALGTPRGFRGMKQCAAVTIREGKRITPSDMTKVSGKDMAYLTKKLFNLSLLLEQDTISDDVNYPTFSGV